jgi:hypothetical protein
MGVLLSNEKKRRLSVFASTAVALLFAAEWQKVKEIRRVADG